VDSAIEQAEQSRAYGSSYIANILQQQQCPRKLEPPLRLREQRLNELELDPVSLLEYDELIFENGSS